MDKMAAERTPGCAISVFKEGREVFRYASGYSSLEKKTPMTGDEFLNIYSCSKVTTVTAALQLLEKGVFLLTDPLYEYIPEFRDMYIKDDEGNIIKAKKPITIRNLFTMTAGFTYDFNSEAFKKARELTGGRMETTEVIKCLASDPLSFEPGTQWQYSLCHDVLAGLVSAITGMPFRDYVRKNIFEPLGMTRSFYHNDSVREKMAEQYIFVPEGQTTDMDIVEAQKCGNASDGTFINCGKDVSHVIGPEYDSGGAGITTVTDDYAKLTAALADMGLGLTGERILAPGTVELMRTNQLNDKQLKSMTWQQLRGYGYGLGVRTLMDKAKSGSTGSVGEFGWGGAAGATVLIDPSLRLGVFFTQHALNPREEYYQPRLRNVIYACI
ncbi:MAG: beta-lactamase family protein [Clostridia bacterium]|nr:beta-lactamase family protein [Clostridia bacterium]